MATFQTQCISFVWTLNGSPRFSKDIDYNNSAVLRWPRTELTRMSLLPSLCSDGKCRFDGRLKIWVNTIKMVAQAFSLILEYMNTARTEFCSMQTLQQITVLGRLQSETSKTSTAHRLAEASPIKWVLQQLWNQYLCHGCGSPRRRCARGWSMTILIGLRSRSIFVLTHGNHGKKWNKGSFRHRVKW